jgi:cytidine deaminase
MPDDDVQRDALFDAARAAARNAHAPYSHLLVGAAIRSASGRIYAGCNVENASYPLGNCAESSAIAAGVQAEGDGFRVAEVAVHAERPDGVPVAASPCGGCRQRLHEFAQDGAVPVHFRWHDGVPHTLSLGELLPWAFVFRR